MKTAANAKLWDSSTGAYKDNPSSTLYPQDGNALAVWYGLTSSSQTSAIMTHLRGNWNSLGAQAPEFNNNISPFSGSMELYAHFTAGDDTNALNMMRDEWGYMLASPIGTASTFWEGYANNGTLNAYSSPFTSLAHGWSTGPTGALTTDVLGISSHRCVRDLVPGRAAPRRSDACGGHLTVASGKTVHASYDHDAAGDFSMQVDSSTNSGSSGVIAVPTWGQARTVTVNGGTAWNGSFSPALTGSRVLTPTASTCTSAASPPAPTRSRTRHLTAPPIAYQSLPGTWTKCAVENGTCAVSGNSVLAFGAGAKFNYVSASSATACDVAVFGDPDSGVAKSCYVESAAPATNSWSQCAAENATCSFSGLMSVAYGANGNYKYATLGSGGTACTNAVFGDPASGA